MPASLQRRLRTLGHGLFRLSEAWQLLATRLDRGLLDEATTTWIKHWCGEALGKPLPLPVDSTHQTRIAWIGKQWCVVDIVSADELSSLWAVVLMLLHLPALKSFWQRALRAQRFALFQAVLPRVWALDTQSLQPGAVIAGLGITSWQDLPRVMATGRKFEVVISGDQPAHAVDAQHWPEMIVAANGQRLRLRELPTFEAEGHVRATWKRTDAGRIVLDV